MMTWCSLMIFKCSTQAITFQVHSKWYWSCVVNNGKIATARQETIPDFSPLLDLNVRKFGPWSVFRSFVISGTYCSSHLTLTAVCWPERQLNGHSTARLLCKVAKEPNTPQSSNKKEAPFVSDLTCRMLLSAAVAAIVPSMSAAAGGGARRPAGWCWAPGGLSSGWALRSETDRTGPSKRAVGLRVEEREGWKRGRNEVSVL